MWIFVPPPTREREKEKEKWKKNYVLFANYQMRLKSESRLYVNASHVPDSMFDVARTDLPSLSLSLSLLLARHVDLGPVLDRPPAD